MSVEQLGAARRDASMHPSPGRAWKYHVVVGRTSDGGAVEAACSRDHGWHETRMMLVDFTERPAAEIPSGMRCQRPGCRQRWPGGTVTR